MSEQDSITIRRPGPKMQDRTGLRYGSLIVVAYHDHSKGHIRWKTRCVCGNMRIVPTSRLAEKAIQCVECALQNQRDAHTTHGKTKTSTYKIWIGMRERCYKPTYPNYHNYGGRGIKVCERWLESFENFLTDMGERPSSKYSLDRINNDGNYEPANCRWATATEQRNNSRQNVFLEYNGERKTVIQWERHLHVTLGLVRDRLRRGWSVERALTEPPRKIISKS
jgi:hypothetical protein